VVLAAIWSLSFYAARAALARFPALRATLCAGAILVYFGLLLKLQPHSAIAVPGMLHDPSSLSSLEWIQYLAARSGRDASAALFYNVLRLPTWCALGVVVFAILRAYLGPAPFAWPTRSALRRGSVEAPAGRA
jgi:hypothetical protein